MVVEAGLGEPLAGLSLLAQENLLLVLRKSQGLSFLELLLELAYFLPLIGLLTLAFVYAEQGSLPEPGLQVEAENFR